MWETDPWRLCCMDRYVDWITQTRCCWAFTAPGKFLLQRSKLPKIRIWQSLSVLFVAFGQILHMITEHQCDPVKVWWMNSITSRPKKTRVRVKGKKDCWVTQIWKALKSSCPIRLENLAVVFLQATGTLGNFLWTPGDDVPLSPRRDPLNPR